MIQKSISPNAKINRKRKQKKFDRFVHAAKLFAHFNWQKNILNHNRICRLFFPTTKMKEHRREKRWKRNAFSQTHKIVHTAVNRCSFYALREVKHTALRLCAFFCLSFSNIFPFIHLNFLLSSLIFSFILCHLC